MAKKENQDVVTGGLTDGLNFTPVKDDEERVGALKNGPQQTAEKALTDGYRELHKGNVETRSVKMQILVKPSTAEKLKEAADNNAIKSKNDLVNYLLEKYFEEEEKRG